MVKKYLDIVRDENLLDENIAKRILKNILKALRNLKKVS